MATQAEIAQGLRDTKAKLDSATAKIVKVGTETDTLLQKIKDLEDALPDNASAELVEAFNAVRDQANAVETAATAADEKVPDAPPPPPEG